MTKFEKIMEEYKEFAARVAENHKNLLTARQHLEDPGVNVEMVGKKANELMENNRKMSMEIIDYFSRFEEAMKEESPAQSEPKKATEDV